jgi:hypothetical protein
MFVGGPNIRKDYHLEEGEEVCVCNSTIEQLSIGVSLFSKAFLSTQG